MHQTNKECSTSGLGEVRYLKYCVFTGHYHPLIEIPLPTIENYYMKSDLLFPVSSYAELVLIVPTKLTRLRVGADCVQSISRLFKHSPADCKNPYSLPIKKSQTATTPPSSRRYSLLPTRR